MFIRIVRGPALYGVTTAQGIPGAIGGPAGLPQNGD